MNSLAAEAQAVMLQSLDKEQVWQVIQTMSSHSDLLQSNWCIPPEAGRFLHLLTRVQNATRIVEIGTSIGFSTLHLALGIAENLNALSDTLSTPAFISTIDASVERQNKAKQWISEAGLIDLVDFQTGSALNVLSENAPFWKDSLDLVFIDARKDEYLAYTQILFSCLRPGGLLIADNAQSHRQEMQDFIDFMLIQDRQETLKWDCCDLNTPNGLIVARKRS